MHKENIVAIVGGGGREAAEAEKYAESDLVDGVLVVPGNDGIKLVTRGKLIDNPKFRKVKTTDSKSLVQLFDHYNVELVDVAQDDAIAAGVADESRNAGFLTIGPSRAAGKIESDKALTRFIGRVVGINQPDFMEFDDPEFAIGCIKTWEERTRWIKASGLAKGKGAMRAKTKEEAYDRIRSLDQFGEAGKRFLIEENLMNDDGTPGEEFSYFVLCNGQEFTYLGSANDHKPIGDGDTGPNTGGMGGNNNPEIVNKEVRKEVEKT
ncbi:MAG: hypothetical protein WCV81_04370 [Microgenomates group bacterium]|jgi:phosphoribosylamine--glycine ligase